MKRSLLLIIVVFLFFSPLISQNNVNQVDSIKYSYCEIYTKDIGLSGKVSIEINSGNISKSFDDTTYRSPLYPDVFSGLIKALNYMGNNGWELVQVYSVLTGPSSMATYSYHYVLKKRIN